ncbi:MAG: hypothetical protein M1823_000278 [Watsoniomyces obsoletus]|nr:MAG: hypothetical protein M1823_000278 [Watsoniomyces obsoletus]
MIYFPALRRRLLLVALLILVCVTIYKASLPRSSTLPPLRLYAQHPSPAGVRIPISELQHRPFPLLNGSGPGQGGDPHELYRPSSKQMPSHHRHNESGLESPNWGLPALNPHLQPFLRCPVEPNRFTGHLRLPHQLYNVSLVPQGSSQADSRTFWNPTIISLPYWSRTQYLVVARIVTEGLHQENVLCEADICHADPNTPAPEGQSMCSEEDLRWLGPSGGMRCVTPPISLNVPPTPAEICEDRMASFADIPGFHDPRVFWSGRGEPLMMINSQSRYACFGLWVIDLRVLHPPLKDLLASSPTHPSLGPLMSYPAVTELTRNPRSDRSAMEKNWMFFSTSDAAYLQYEISPERGRAFAKLLGSGLTSPNITDPREQACLVEGKSAGATWHQATNSVRLVLCERADARCKPDADNTVFVAIVHRKYSNGLNLPMRYERYIIMWSATPPFHMLGVSQHPILLANETASGWSAAENWDDSPSALDEGRDMWAYFTYTVSIAYAWGRKGDEAIWKNTGYLDDEVILSVGIDDGGLAYAKVPARELIQCLKACPGMRQESPETED